MTCKTVAIPAIEKGTVIDHIDAGQALPLISLLHLDQSPGQYTAAFNLESSRIGTKDLIKITNRYLSEKEAGEIAVFSPRATLNIIEDYTVTKKIPVALPDEIHRLITCPNTNCITHFEPIDTLFFIRNRKNQVFLQCKYCEKSFNL